MDMVSVAGMTCRRVAINQDGYVFQSITDPTLYFALTQQEFDDQLRAGCVRSAKKD